MKKEKQIIKKRERKVYIKRASAWVKSLFLLFFIVLPIFFIWFITSPDFGRNIFGFNFGIFFLIALAFFVYSFIITFIFFYFKILDLQIFSFVIPISISLCGIYLTYPLPIWARFLITVFLIMTAIPTNFFVNKIEDNLIWKAKIFSKKT